MALIKCSECGREISDKAATCPGCGAPVSIATTTAVAPAAVSFSEGVFKSTKSMLIDVAVKAIQSTRYKVDQVNEGAGIIAFTTGMTFGSWSGVSASLILTETAPFTFTVTGSAKQNVRGGQLVALDLFGEAKSKVDKVIREMERLTS